MGSTRRLAPLCLLALLGCDTGVGKINVNQLTFSQHIAPTVDRYCVDCHKEGGIAPFTLTSYDDVLGRRGQIEQAILSRVMPPWGAQAAAGCPSVQNSHWLPDWEIERFQFWMRSGAPRGRPLAALTGESNPELKIQAPDLIAQAPLPHTPDFTNVNDTYPCVLASAVVPGDRWIDALAFTPENIAMDQPARHCLQVRNPASTWSDL